jgi:glycosyltransferase involved in cell wall biosynthesis
MKISVIIPMYNSQNYIERAINSVTNQSYKDYEIILIDDSSKDDTVSICNKYLSNNIKLIKLETNKGVSNARNIGINNSSGEYIIFLDSDDWLDSNCLYTIINNFLNNDLIIYGTNYNRVSGIFKQPLPTLGSLSKNDLFSDIFLLLDVSIAHWVTNKAFKSSIIKDNNLSFNTDLKMGEDLDFCLKYIEKVNNIKILDEYLYYYDRTNDGSLTNSNIATLPERTKFNNDNIENFLIRNNIELTDFKTYKKNLFNYVITKINQSSYSNEDKKVLLDKNKLLNND